MESNVKYRLKYSKLGKVKYIGHLDLLRLFRLTINRSKLPVAYSLGFNPHQIISFALPLSLGMESTGEYADLELESEIPCDNVISALNGCFPEGIEILNCRMLMPDNNLSLSDEKAAASIVRYAEYTAEIAANLNYTGFNNASDESFDEAINEMMKSNEVIAEIKTKKGGGNKDIRPLVQSISRSGRAIKMIISAGGAGNLKPDALMSCLFKRMELNTEACGVKYTRTELYDTNMRSL